MKRISFLILFITFLSSAYGDEVVIVVAKDSKVNEVSRAELKNFFTGKRNMIAGIAMVPVVYKNSALHQGFLKKYLNRSQSQFVRSWQKLVFTGKAKMPRKYSNEDKAIQAIHGDIRLIGYVYKSQMTNQLKIVTVRE